VTCSHPLHGSLGSTNSHSFPSEIPSPLTGGGENNSKSQLQVLKTDVSPVLQDTEHADVLTVGLSVDGVERILDLRLNTDLIPVGYQQRYQRRGTYEVHSPSRVVSTLETPSRSLRATPLTACPQTMLVKSITNGGGFYRIQRPRKQSEGFIRLNRSPRAFAARATYRHKERHYRRLMARYVTRNLWLRALDSLLCGKEIIEG